MANMETSSIQRCLSLKFPPLFIHGIAFIPGIGFVGQLLGLNLVIIIVGLGRMCFFITFGGCFQFLKLLLHALESHLGSIVLDAKVSGDCWDVDLRVELTLLTHFVRFERDGPRVKHNLNIRDLVAGPQEQELLLQIGVFGLLWLGWAFSNLRGGFGWSHFRWNGRVILGSWVASVSRECFRCKKVDIWRRPWEITVDGELEGVGKKKSERGQMQVLIVASLTRKPCLSHLI